MLCPYRGVLAVVSLRWCYTCRVKAVIKSSLVHKNKLIKDQVCRQASCKQDGLGSFVISYARLIREQFEASSFSLSLASLRQTHVSFSVCGSSLSVCGSGEIMCVKILIIMLAC